MFSPEKAQNTWTFSVNYYWKLATHLPSFQGCLCHPVFYILFDKYNAFIYLPEDKICLPNLPHRQGGFWTFKKFYSLELPGLPTQTLLKLVDGDWKTGNPSEKRGDLYWSIEGAEGARSQVPKGLGACPPRKLKKKWSSNMRFPAFLGMFIA